MAASSDTESNPASMSEKTQGQVDVAKPKETPEGASSEVEEIHQVADGGAKAWMTVAGAWLVLFGTFGYLYSFGVYQDYYTRHFLSNHGPSKIAWIGSFQLMMPFALGIVSGKLFDAGHFHAVEIFGSSIFVFSLFMLSLANPQQYYQVFLSQGVGMGIGLGFTFVPTVGITVHHFKRRKALATGIALSGSSIGAIVFPIMMNNLFEDIGFAETVRSTAYIVLSFVIAGNALMGTAYSKTRAKGPQLDLKSFFKDPPYMVAVIGALVSSFGFYFPLIYLQLYAVQHSIDINMAFYSLAILNALSAVGRIAGNFLADVYGPFNILVPCTLITGATIFAVFGVGTGSLIAVSIVYGLFSGAWLSLAMASLGSLARHPSETGARIGLALALSSFGSLGAAPVQGSLLTHGFTWGKPIAFSGTLMVASAFILGITRMLLAKERSTNKV